MDKHRCIKMKDAITSGSIKEITFSRLSEGPHPDVMFLYEGEGYPLRTCPFCGVSVIHPDAEKMLPVLN